MRNYKEIKTRLQKSNSRLAKKLIWRLEKEEKQFNFWKPKTREL